MARPYDRPATVAALVNAVLVFVLPVATVMILMAIRRGSGNGAMVVGVDPDRAAALTRKVRMIAGYLAFMSPFATAAGWRTLVHARRWLDGTAAGAQGILEGGLCGLAGAVLVLLPGILTKPLQAPPFVIAYGGLSAVIGLAIGVILWIAATATLKLMAAAHPTVS